MFYCQQIINLLEVLHVKGESQQDHSSLCVFCRLAEFWSVGWFHSCFGRLWKVVYDNKQKQRWLQCLVRLELDEKARGVVWKKKMKTDKHVGYRFLEILAKKLSTVEHTKKRNTEFDSFCGIVLSLFRFGTFASTPSHWPHGEHIACKQYYGIAINPLKHQHNQTFPCLKSNGIFFFFVVLLSMWPFEQPQRKKTQKWSQRGKKIGSKLCQSPIVMNVPRSTWHETN